MAHFCVTGPRERGINALEARKGWPCLRRRARAREVEAVQETRAELMNASVAKANIALYGISASRARCPV